MPRIPKDSNQQDPNQIYAGEFGIFLKCLRSDHIYNDFLTNILCVGPWLYLTFVWDE